MRIQTGVVQMEKEGWGRLVTGRTRPDVMDRVEEHRK